MLGRPELVAPHLASRRAVLITNRVVAPLYLDRLAATVRSTGAQVTPIVIEDGEAAKDWRTLDKVFDQLLAARCGRDSVILALGGGVVGDLAGFAAAVYQRGIPFVQVPTTLLAQVDSSVGGKTAINHPRGKNMIGAFHQPVAVLSDIATLDSLPMRELAAGLAEVIKHGLILDASFTEWLEKNMAALRRRDPEALAFAVRRSCELKAKIVSADERETGLRAILNFGHTFAHAIEAAAGYGRWLHGEAVAAGMVMGCELSARLGLLSEPQLVRVRKLIEQAGLPLRGPAIAAEQLLDWMRVDKKIGAGRMRFIVLAGVGMAEIRDDVDERMVLEVLRCCSAAS